MNCEFVRAPFLIQASEKVHETHEHSAELERCWPLTSLVCKEIYTDMLSWQFQFHHPLREARIYDFAILSDENLASHC